MGKVVTGLSMSLDGFIAGPNDSAERILGDGGERLLGWYFSGDTDYRLPGTEMVFKVSLTSADFLREVHRTIGVMVQGRRTFDIANGWGGDPPWAYRPSLSPTRSPKDGFTKDRPSPLSRTASRAPSSK